MIKSEGNDEIEVMAKPDSLSIKAKGGVASRLGHQIADVISPFSGLLGIAGDQIDHFRMFRKESAAAALLRAKEIREHAGKQVHPIPIKLLAPWLEGASSEDIGKENILELWAKILATSPEDLDSAFLRYIEVTRNIGPREAEFFQKVMSRYTKTQIPKGFFDDTSLATKNHNLAASGNNIWLVDLRRQILSADGALISRGELISRIQELNDVLMGQVVHFMALRSTGNTAEIEEGKKVPVIDWIEWENPNQTEIELLRLIGLAHVNDGLERAGLTKRDSSDSVISLQIMEPTVLGCSFYFSVIAEHTQS